MLEILLVVVISKKIAAMMKEKGRAATGYVVMFVLGWFGGEIFGGIVGVALSFAVHPGELDEHGFECFAYILALIGAAVGGTTAFLIAKAVPAIEDPRLQRLAAFDDEDEDYYDDRPRRRRDWDGDSAAIKKRRPSRNDDHSDRGEFEERP